MNPFTATAAEIAAAIATGKADPVDLAEGFLSRIGEIDPQAQIYARTTPQRARAEALAARERARSGTRRTVLDGVPASWKDLFDTAGVATESGSKLLAGRTPDRDAVLVEIATAAGMVCLGKTHQTELAFSGLGVNPSTATSPNALMPGHAPGGSSSGAAASVAHGLSPIAMGSDTGGSVRIPAAWNSLAGLKVTWGALPDGGMVPLCPSFDTPGPLARTVEDLAIAFDVLKGGTGAYALQAPGLSGMHLHVAETIVLDRCDDAVSQAFEAALKQLAKAGAIITSGPVAEFEDCAAIAPNLYPFEAWRQWGETIEARGEIMYEPVRRRFMLGRNVTADEHTNAASRMQALRQSYAASTNGIDAVLMPSVPILPPRVDSLMADGDHFTERNLMALRNTRFANTLGLCALTVPLPQPACGLMLYGKPFGEARLLAIGAAVEKAVKA